MQKATLIISTVLAVLSLGILFYIISADVRNGMRKLRQYLDLNQGLKSRSEAEESWRKKEKDEEEAHK